MDFSNGMVGANMDVKELDSDLSGRDKMQHHQSQGIDPCDREASKMAENEELYIVETQSSQVLNNNTVDIADKNKSSILLVDHNDSKSLDLNSVRFTDDNSGCNYNSEKNPSDVKEKTAHDHKCKYSNAPLSDTCCSYQSHNQLKKRNTLNSGRITDPIEKKDALKKWKEMKQSGFISSSSGGIPTVPKPRGRKRKSNVLKQKLEQAKKEQVDKFTKFAAPSGLLKELNPGIINHVRNSKQVYSIIQALVQSEKQESRELCEVNAEKENMNLFSNEVSVASIPESKLFCDDLFCCRSSHLSLDSRGRCRDSANKKERFCAKTSIPSHLRSKSKDERLVLKSSSLNIVSENTFSLSNKSASVNREDALSVQAATVAFQWLQLMQHDIKRRLAALHCSKKRVEAVVSTELPLLLSTELFTNQENDPYNMKESALSCSNKAAAELHQAKWSKLFCQMITKLSEEEKHLEEWLNEVNTMLLCCDEGLQHSAALNNEFRCNDPVKGVSVRAAAASIYSTCNFLFSRKNVGCT